MVAEDQARNVFIRRLTLACDRAGIEPHGRQATLAAALGVTPKAVSKWFNGEAMPRRAKLQALAALVEAPGDWLLGYGEEERAAPRLPSGENRRPAAYRVELLDVQASAGPGCLMVSDVVDTLRAIEYAPEQARALFGQRPCDTVKVITVRGDSMAGTLDPGDHIFLDMNVNRFDGDGIYVFVFGKTLHVKRLQMRKNALLVLSDNPLYKEWTIDENDEDQFFIMAKVLLRQTVSNKRLA